MSKQNNFFLKASSEHKNNFQHLILLFLNSTLRSPSASIKNYLDYDTLGNRTIK
jgi:hypothetical protein